MSTPAFPDRAAIRAGQAKALRAMVSELVPNNPFYAPKVAAFADALARSGKSDAACLEVFFRLAPFTTKRELVEDQLAHPPYGTDLTYPLDRYTRFSQTSGTTGTPLRWLDTTQSWSWMVDNWVEVFRASGVGQGDRIFFAFSFGPFLGFWTAFEAGVRLGCLCLPGGGMNSAARLRAILDNEVTTLCCTPTYAIRLAEVAAEEKIDFAGTKVKTMIVAGEPGGSIPATRSRIERLWPGAKVKDHHGMTEIGPVTFECSAAPGLLHVMESGFIPEVVDPATGRQAGPGEQGELILTNLGRAGSPLIRYRTGDLVIKRKWPEETSCACGRYDLALEGGILGRTDDMVVVRGVNLHPTAVEEVLRGFDRVAEYRVELFAGRAMAEIEIQLEPEPGCADGAMLGNEVEAALRTAFHLRVPVSVVPPGTLPRFEMKAKRWIVRQAEERRV